MERGTAPLITRTGNRDTGLFPTWECPNVNYVLGSEQYSLQEFAFRGSPECEWCILDVFEMFGLLSVEFQGTMYPFVCIRNIGGPKIIKS